MYSDLLEELIDSVLVEGVLSEQKRDVIKRRAEKDGEDAEEVLMIVESRLHKHKPQPKQDIIPKDNKVKKLEEDSESNKKLRIMVPEYALRKVLKEFDYYNKQAAKWGYELLQYDKESHTIIGKFTPKTDAQDGKLGLMKEIKEIYKNGAIEENWKKILKLCGVS